MKVILAGGGTGGHVYPAVAIAHGVIKRYKTPEILFIGTANGLENKIIPMEGFSFKTIKVRGLLRKISVENIIAIKEMLFSFFNVYKIIKDFKPDIVIGTGGYVCGSILVTASLMGIPTLIHEQNAFPGITNRLLSHFVDRIALTFEEASVYFSHKDKIKITGNPLRNDIIRISNKEGKSAFSFSDKLPLVFIVGGSRGAKKINESAKLLVKESNRKKSYQVLHMTGDTQYNATLAMYEENNIAYNNDYVKVVPYVHDMPHALAGADLIVSRCGAGLISEITALGKPSILIPYPYASDNHQEYNAKALERVSAANVILEKDINEQVLLTEIENLLSNPSVMAEMSIQSKKLAKIHATEEIVNIVEELLKRNKKSAKNLNML